MTHAESSSDGFGSECDLENPLPSTDEESENDVEDCKALEEPKQELSNDSCHTTQRAAAALATGDGQLMEMKEAQMGFWISNRQKSDEQMEECENATTAVAAGVPAAAAAAATAPSRAEESTKATSKHTKDSQQQQQQQQQQQRKVRNSIHVSNPDNGRHSTPTHPRLDMRASTAGRLEASSAVGAFSVSPEENPTRTAPPPSDFTSSVGGGSDDGSNSERDNSLQRLLMPGVKLVEAELVEEQPLRQRVNSQHTTDGLSMSDPESGSVIAPKDASLIVEAVAAPHLGFCLISLFSLILLGMGVLLITVVLLTIQGGDGSSSSSSDLEPINNNHQTILVFPQIGQTMIGTAAYDKFGGPLTLSSDGMIVAIAARSNSDMGRSSGLVRVYKLEKSSENQLLWTTLGSAVGGQNDGDQFAFSGMAMSSDGYRIAAGAPFFTTEDQLEKAGHVRVFDFNSTKYSWSQVGPSLDGLGEDHLFGRAVTLSADGKIIASSSYQSSENGNFSAHIRIFQETQEQDAVAWKQMGSTLLGEAAYDRLGRSMAISTNGTILAAGAIQFKDKMSVVGTGYVKVFRYNSDKNDWDVLGQPLWGDNDHDLFGRDVAISSDGTILACGAHFGDDNGNEDSGYVRIYRLVENDGQSRWDQLGQTLRGPNSQDHFGLAVSLSASGHRVAIGADQKSSNSSGYVRIFDLNQHDNQYHPHHNDEWIQWGSDVVGDSPNELFGSFVKLSDDGNILAVGAVGSNANGEDSGEVQVFNLTRPIPRSV